MLINKNEHVKSRSVQIQVEPDPIRAHCAVRAPECAPNSFISFM